MKLSKRKSTLYYVVAFACGLVATFFIYSCSTDEFYSDEIQSEKNGAVGTRAFSSKMMGFGETLVDSVAASDEFWEFQMSSELLAEKYSIYISSLSEEGYDEFMDNINNDDYMAGVIEKANTKEALQQMSEAQENLLKNTGFSRLTEDEKSQLFSQYAESRVKMRANSLIKNPGEGGTVSECQKQKDLAYYNAYNKYENSLALCKGLAAIICFQNVAVIYHVDKGLADENYEKCIGN